MKIRIFLWIMIVLLAGFLLFSSESLMIQRSLSKKTLRLHIVANSNSKADQEQKLRLRDHLLAEIGMILENCNSLGEAEEKLSASLERLEAISRAFLAGEGSSYQVSAQLSKERFPTRDYGLFALPSGEYHSLRMTVGEGKGENWWCVVFPTLCNASTTEEMEQFAETGGYDREEISLITKERRGYTMRFMVVDWIRELFH
ncbi:MAG: stage II sporulation protein R [Oscillospiraceae bacterium]|nr:stage II sporulation protein R [Oscillospiraceae bacterium]